ncbi:MAG: MGMT family protein [Luminiphilus sp.]|nr:MGMT family protein [Luminiphilus sp.]
MLFTVSQIPEGRVSSFGRIAAAAGLPRKARWIGRILSQLPAETSIPWHRVLGHGGNITCPRRDIARTRLLDEGVVVENFKVKMRSYVWPESSDTRSQTKHRAE